jgi:GH25 family lysozyme M1 (1,4-beta-N-acetylmuramidase)
MINYVKGFDLSAWQNAPATPQGIDWEKAKSQDAKFCFIRAAYSTVEDRDFKYNWEHSKGILRGVYQFYDYRYPAKAQAEMLVALMKDDWGELPPVIDVEQPLEHGQPVPFPNAAAYQASVITWMRIVEAACGKRPIIYTGQNIIKYGLRVTSTSPLTKYPLWIAEYRAPVGEPNFTPWPGWTFWQYGTPAVGLQYGMESKELDMDLYHGTYDELLTFAGIQTPPKPELTLEQRVERLEKLHNL